ncbi:MAG: ribosome recycling factor [Flavobacteriales bacterium]|jgi:ribosome recycling factor|nr:ribosome recycling factor [Flavobacteriales bacterium]
MSEEIKMALDEAAENMGKAIEHLENELSKVRAGKASPAMLDGVRVDYYGSMTPLKNIANVSTPDPRTLVVQAWEKHMLDAISKAILEANLGLNPQNNGDVVIISVPMLTEERRKDLSKRAHAEGEHARVSIRSARHDAIQFIKQAQKDGLPEDEAKTGEAKVQELTDKFNRKVDEVIAAKDKDIMTI